MADESPENSNRPRPQVRRRVVVGTFFGIVVLPLLLLIVSLFVVEGVTADNLVNALGFLIGYLVFFPYALVGIHVHHLPGELLRPWLTVGGRLDPMVALCLVGYLIYGLWMALMLKFRSVRVFRFLAGGLALLVGLNAFWLMRALRAMMSSGSP